MLAVALYMLKVTLISGILFGYYLLALKNERFHSWNRYYLVLSAVLSMVLPFASWSSLFSAYEPAAVEVHRLNAFTLKAHAGEAAFTSGPQSPHWPLILYALVCLFLLGSLLHVLSGLLRRIRVGDKQEFALYTLVADPGPDSPFSFFRYIFWNEAIPLQSREGRQILRHELVHVRQNHSFDKLLLETILVVCWINPFFYLIRRELHTIHEFIADRKSCYPKNCDPAVSGNVNPREYATLLVTQALGIHRTGVTSHFFQKQLSRRVRMLIRENKARCTWLKRVMAIPLALALMSFFMILQSQARDKGVSLLSHMKAPAKIFRSTPPLAKNREAAGENKVEGDAASRTTKITPPKKPSLASMMIKMLPDADPDQELTADVGLRPTKVFTFVENMPTFPGGEAALFSYLDDHIHYPEAAMKNGVQGTVVVQFVVHPDGTLSDVTAVGPVKGDGLEQEAGRVVRNMPDWTPGRQDGSPVAVRYSLPVRFSLAKNDNDATPPPAHSSGSSSSSPAGTVFTFVEQMPTFPGGEAGLMRYLHDNIRYPSKAREQGIQGTVSTRFIVNADGSLSGIETTGAERGGGLEEEAIRVISQMPSWHPGIQNGRKVSVAYSLPIKFVLQ